MHVEQWSTRASKQRRTALGGQPFSHPPPQPQQSQNAASTGEHGRHWKVGSTLMMSTARSPERPHKLSDSDGRVSMNSMIHLATATVQWVLCKTTPITYKWDITGHLGVYQHGVPKSETAWSTYSWHST